MTDQEDRSQERAPDEEPPVELDDAQGSEDGDEGDLLDDQADLAEDFVNGLLDVMGMDGEAEADFGDDDIIVVKIEGPDMAVLIGRHGATLEALQDLTRAAVQHATHERAFLMVDIAGYRDRQRERIERDARHVAERVMRDGRSEEMEPMSSYERKIVHDVLSSVAGVTTGSEGEEPERFVVVYPA